MSSVSHPHIEFNSDQVPVIVGTTTKVVEIAQDHLAHHWHAEDIHRQYPYLSLAQIHAALTYYYDHQAEIDQDIERRSRHIAAIQDQHHDETNRVKLHDLGHLP